MRVQSACLGRFSNTWGMVRRGKSYETTGAAVRRAQPLPAGWRQRLAAASVRSADTKVLCSSIVTVIGPTPPGTGVI